MLKLRVTPLLLILLIAGGTAQAVTIQCGVAHGLAANVCRMTTFSFLSGDLGVDNMGSIDNLSQYGLPWQLTGITVALDAEVDMRGMTVVPNNPGIPGTATDPAAYITVQLFDSMLVPILSVDSNPASLTGTYTIPPEGVSLGGGIDNPSGSRALSSPFPGYFIGSGSFSLPIVVLRTQTGSFTNSQVDGGFATSGTKATVSYTYVIPEPATMLLIGSSLLGLAILARRKMI